MEVAEAAFRFLQALAEADGDVSPDERALLEHYREALGLAPRRRLRSRRARHRLAVNDHEHLANADHERTHVLRMMTQVAYADGRRCARETRRLELVSDHLGIGRLQYADIIVEVGREAAHRRNVRRGWIAGIAALAVVGFGVTVYSTSRSARADSRIDALATEQARQDASRVRASAESLHRVQSDLESRIAILEGAPAPSTTDRGGSTAGLSAQLAELRAQLAKTRALTTAFQDIERRHRESILLVVTQVELVKGKDRQVSQVAGSGFFVTTNGWLATNKHVIEPWKFKADLVQLLDDGYEIDKVWRAVWPAGARVLRDGHFDLAGAYHSRDGSLRVAATAPDTLVQRTRELASGKKYTGEFHDDDDHDLALLQATVAEPVLAFRLADADEAPAKLDRVMVLGFPRGLQLLEREHAETSPSLGEVRKVEQHVHVSAPIVGGNSGGPVVDASGQVIGVATWTVGSSTLGSCIRTKHVLELLPPASTLIAKARRLAEQPERSAAARQLLDLAGQRSPGEDELAEIAAIRQGLR